MLRNDENTKENVLASGNDVEIRALSQHVEKNQKIGTSFERGSFSKKIAMNVNKSKNSL